MFPNNTTYHSLSKGTTISSVNQCIPHNLCNPKVHHTFHQNPLFVPILSQLNQMHVNTRHFFQTHFIRSVNEQMGTFCRYSYQGPWKQLLSLKNVPHALPFSFFRLLFSTIVCILRSETDASILVVLGLKFITTSVTCYWKMVRGADILKSWPSGHIK